MESLNRITCWQYDSRWILFLSATTCCYIFCKWCDVSVQPLHEYLQYRTFGYGHSFGVLSHFYGREAGLELREDIESAVI